MAKFCTMCGSPIPDPTNDRCDACLAAQEQTAAIEPGFKARPQQQSIELHPLAEWAKEALLSPSAALNRATGFANAVPGLVIAVVGSIVAALAAVLFIRRILDSILSALMGGFGELFYSDVVPNYGSAFFRLLLLLLLQWVVLSLVVTGTARMFKQRVTVIQSLNIVGMTKLYLGIGAIAALILQYIIPALAIVVLLAVIVMGYLAIERGIRPLLRQQGDSFYLIPSALGLYGVCVCLLWQIFF
ncbi:hypothetical protein COLU111180_17005 [Cohnella lubricantis]|uniref:Yip1 domain-containing protein n=1 Tax=Cohnella lubricantis TaxID=2163172 RepID=A0A841TG75_9BACL|nr:hypothetical protein [Cohnella lubricantis]MBB6677947.1 hypothetical protein [Cohnella lubricantis]MBP2119985.1 hypothetical protein [Cohnella lubricantis]